MAQFGLFSYIDLRRICTQNRTPLYCKAGGTDCLHNSYENLEYQFFETVRIS